MLSRLLLAIVGIMMATGSLADTVWWRTKGATVVQTKNVCSLYIYDNERAAIFTWNKNGTESVAIDDSRLHLDGVIVADIQIGDTWLEGRQAIGERTMIAMQIEQPIVDLLRNATQLTVIVPNDQIVINLTPEKMPPLLTAVGKCQAVLR